MKRQVLCGWLALFVLGHMGVARGSDISDKYRDDDARLLKKVTIAPGQLLVGDLIADLQNQTGVSIEVDSNAYATGVEVFASGKGVRLSDFLDGIWALLSNSDGEYRWNREGPPGHYRYSLYEPIAVKRRVEILHRFAQQAYVDFVNTMCDLAAMTPDQRRRRKDILAKAMIETDDQQVDRWMNNDANWSQMSLFAELVPKADRESILLGDRALTVQVADISDKSRELFNGMWTRLDARIKHADGTVTQQPMPTTIHLYAVTHGTIATIMMDTGPNVRDSLFTTMPVQTGLLNRVKKRWILQLDTTSDRLQNEPVHELAGAGNSEFNDLTTPLSVLIKGKTPQESYAIINRVNRSKSFSSQLRRIAERSGVAVLAVLPSQPVFVAGKSRMAVPAMDPPGTKSVSSNEPTVAEALAPLEQFGNPLMHKWRNGILLVSYPEWFFDDGRSLPYGLVKEFSLTGNGDLPLDSLARLMVKATDRQFGVLGEHYPILQAATTLRPAFLLYKLRPKIINRDGITVDPESLQFLQISRFGTRPAVKDGRIQRVRIVEVEHAVGGRTGMAIEFQGFVDERWSVLAGFIKPDPVKTAP